jgi:CcmD family protein
MSESSSMLWVAVVMVVIWSGIFAYCLGLDRRLRRMEDQQ